MPNTRPSYLFTQVDSQRKGTSRSLITGSLISVKDNFMVKGVRSSAGSRILGEYRADYDATVVKNVRSHGAILFGKVGLDGPYVQ